MKKSIIALAVAGAVTAPIVAQADATLYGRVHQRVIFAEDSDLDINNSEARIGVKGSSQMDSGLTAFYNIEMGINGDNSGNTVASGDNDNSALSSRTDGDVTQYRQVHAGVKGDFGQVKIGRFTNPMVSTYTTDLFEYKSGNYQAIPYRVGNAVSYTTPQLGPVSLYGVVVGQGESNDQFEDVDAYVVGLDSSFGPVTANVGYYDAENPAGSGLAGNREVVSLGLAYSANNLYVGLNYEERDEHSEIIGVAGTYTIGKTTIGAEYNQREYDDSALETSKVYRLGVYQNLGGKADAYAEIVSEDNISGANGTDATDFVLGYRVKF